MHDIQSASLQTIHWIHKEIKTQSSKKTDKIIEAIISILFYILKKLEERLDMNKYIEDS